MGIDILKERTLTLSEGELLPGKPSRKTLWDYKENGIELDDGTVVKLEVVWVGRRKLVTSMEAFDRFIRRINGNLAPEKNDARKPRRPKRR